MAIKLAQIAGEILTEKERDMFEVSYADLFTINRNIVKLYNQFFSLFHRCLNSVIPNKPTNIFDECRKILTCKLKPSNEIRVVNTFTHVIESEKYSILIGEMVNKSRVFIGFKPNDSSENNYIGFLTNKKRETRGEMGVINLDNLEVSIKPNVIFSDIIKDLLTNQKEIKSILAKEETILDFKRNKSKKSNNESTPAPVTNASPIPNNTAIPTYNAVCNGFNIGMSPVGVNPNLIKAPMIDLRKMHVIPIQTQPNRIDYYTAYLRKIIRYALEWDIRKNTDLLTIEFNDELFTSLEYISYIDGKYVEYIQSYLKTAYQYQSTRGGK